MSLFHLVELSVWSKSFLWVKVRSVLSDKSLRQRRKVRQLDKFMHVCTKKQKTTGPASHKLIGFDSMKTCWKPTIGVLRSLTRMSIDPEVVELTANDVVTRIIWKKNYARCEKQQTLARYGTEATRYTATITPQDSLIIVSPCSSIEMIETFIGGWLTRGRVSYHALPKISGFSHIYSRTG